MRIACGIEYDGLDYFGWQTQAQEPTVQACVEKALSRVADHPIKVVCSGRTDTGVHAACQVIHFDTDAQRGERAWALGCNTQLPETISVLWARPVGEDFHARFSASSRRYRYSILNRWTRSALLTRRCAWIPVALDDQLMHQAATKLIGRHDFSTFRASGCQAQHAVREVSRISVTRDEQQIHIDIEANAFLQHMVRNIAGTLIKVGRGEHPPQWVGDILAAKDRRLAGMTAPPQGLVFLGPRYAQKYSLPIDAGPAFLRNAPDGTEQEVG